MRRTLIVIGGVSSSFFFSFAEDGPSSGILQSTECKRPGPSDLLRSVSTTSNRITRSVLCRPRGVEDLRCLVLDPVHAQCMDRYL